MSDCFKSLDCPIRVVVFCGGPTLDAAVQQFIRRLETEPEIEFLGAFCQSPGQSFKAVVLDLWQRRGVLAGPLLGVQAMTAIARFLMHPRAAIAQRREGVRLASRVQFVPDIHAQDVLEQMQDLSPDLGLIYGAPILKPALFALPTFGTLGIHHGKVPEYRGKKTTFWAMFNGEKTVGVTIQRVNAGLDTGDVVKAGEVPVDRRSLRTVWQELEALGFDLYLQAILDVKRGAAHYRPQIGKKGPLYRDPSLSDMLKFHCRQLKRHLRKHEVISGWINSGEY